MDMSLNMSSPSAGERKKGKGKIVLLLVMIAIGLGLFAYVSLYEDTPPVPASPPKPKPLKKTEAPIAAGETVTNIPKGGSSPVPDKPHEALNIPKAGSLGKMTELIAIREELKLQKDIAGLRKQVDELNAPAAAAMPEPARSAGPVKIPQNAPVKVLEKAEDAPETDNPKERRGAFMSRILSIQGVNGALSARVMNSEGEVSMLQTGSAWSGGIVSAITREGITMKINGRRVFIAYVNGE